MPHAAKFVKAETKIIDGDEAIVSAIVSTEDVDRDGDIIRQDGWDLQHFKTHPVLMSSHNYHGLTNVIGEWISMEVVGKQLVGQAQYYIGKNPEADYGFFLAGRDKAAFSVGFIPDMAQAKEIQTNGKSAYEFHSQELLEVSQVALPSNRQSLQRMKGIGLDSVMEKLVDEILDDMEPENDTPVSPAVIAQIASGTEGHDLALAEKIASLVRQDIRIMIDEYQNNIAQFYQEHSPRTPSLSLDAASIVRNAIREHLDF